MRFTDLSQEVKEMIFSYVEFRDLEQTRSLQSKHYRRKTEYNSFSEAAEHGNLHNMKWLLSIGCKMEPDIFSKAAYNGNIANMNWLLANKFTLDKHAFIGAMIPEKISISVLQWLYENKCPWHEKTYILAVSGKDYKVKDWLIKKKCPRYILRTRTIY